MFRFRTLDLFLITAGVAVIAGVQQVELVFFRQLLWFALVSLISATAVAALSMIPQKRIVGGFGGFTAGCIYFALSIDNADWMYASNFRVNGFNQSADPFLESLLVFVFSFPVGSAIGPLLAIRFRETGLPNEFDQPINWSRSLLGGTFLVGFFMMLDRLRHETRDWTILMVLLFIAFVVYTLAWLNRLEKLDNPLKTDGLADNLEPK